MNANAIVIITGAMILAQVAGNATTIEIFDFDLDGCTGGGTSTGPVEADGNIEQVNSSANNMHRSL
jgi:hypothetical protein